MDITPTNQNTPLVSVVMPIYNADRFLEAAITSVQEQTVTDWELLLIDDCSTDNSGKIAEAFAEKDHRIRYIINAQNAGVSESRNKGIDLGTGAYIAFLDSDDVWYPEKLEKQLSEMARTGADFCYCAYAIVDEQGNRSRPEYLVPAQVDFPGLLQENVIGCSTVMVRRELLRTNRFGNAFYHEDYVLWLTLLRQGVRVCGCTQVLADWRLIANSRSFNKFRSAHYRWRIYRECLKLPLGESLRAFVGYMTAGLRKYR